jgi:hypothetical protein
VGTFLGSTSTQNELLAAPPCYTGQTGVAGKIRRETNECRPGRIPSGRRTQGCPRLGRQARTSSNIAEMKKEQHDRVGKVREKKNEKVNMIKIDSIVDLPQPVVALYIYTVGRSCPTRKSFYKPNLPGLLNLARNRGAPVRPVHPACRSCRSHISLIRTPIWMFHI